MQLQGRNLQSGLSGEDVAALHRELMFLGYDVPEDERRGWFFGTGTARAVAAFQQGNRLPTTGIVDAPTAQAFGRAVQGVGTRAESPPTREYPAPVPEPPATPERADEPPLTKPVGGPGQEQDDQTGATKPIPEDKPSLQEEQSPADKPSLQEEQGQDDQAGTGPDSPDGEDDAGDEGGPSLTEVRGVLLSSRGIAAEGVTLRFYERGFGGRARPLGGTVTRARGKFLIAVRLRGLKGTFLDVRAEGPDDEEVRLVAPGRRINPKRPVKLVIPADKLPSSQPSEHDRLTQVLAPHLEDLELSEAQEDDERQDITLLHEATGWDARLIALGASAAKLAKETELDPKALYGMLRAGLPNRRDQLVQVTKAGVGHALRKATDAGVVSLDDQEIEAAQERFEQYARRERRHLAAPGTPSSYGALLKATGLDQAQQDQIDEILTGHTGDPEQLWQKTDEAGLPTAQLKLTASLAALTGNSARLVEDLRERAGSPEQLGQTLANERLYQAGPWADRLRALASGNETVLGKMIPPGYQAETLDERLEAYTGDLAKQVRSSYPTRVLSQKVATGELQLRDIPLDGAGEPGDEEDEDPAVAAAENEGAEAGAGALRAGDDALPPLASEQVRGDVATVLERAADRDFELGATPLHQFVNEHDDELFANLPDERAQVAKRQVETLQRLYQITPSDEALQALQDGGFASAHQIAKLPRQQFLQLHGERFPSRAEANLTWLRARQVDAVTLNLTQTALGSLSRLDGVVLQRSGNVQAEQQGGVVDVEQQPAPPPDLSAILEQLGMSPDDPQVADTIKQFPTLEGLFGSLDYPECDHCESVLSPAAYFVDLLRFLDHKPNKGPNPYIALAERRPDLPHIALTCDNTETALPYIDIVNEILERFVVSKKVTKAAALDNDGASSEELIAEPRHVLAAAYDKLKEDRYPLELPFDLWLETVRAFASHFDIPFWQILEAVRTTDELQLSDEGGTTAYGRAAVAYERLGFSADDIAILTSADPEAQMPELYGEPDDTSATGARDELFQAKILARRLGVSYHELVDLVGTAFVNPRQEALAVLRSYGVSTTEARLYMASGQQSLTTAQRQDFEEKLGTDGLAWLQGAWNDGDLARIVVLAAPEPSEGPDTFETTELWMADGSPAHPMVLVLLNYFVRIWRRLDWSLDEVDRALAVCLPEEPDLAAPAVLGPAMATALLGMAYLDELTERLNTGRQGRTELLGLWAPLDDQRFEELFPGEPLPSELLEILGGGEDGGTQIGAQGGTQRPPLQLTQAVEGMSTLRPLIGLLPPLVGLNVLHPGIVPQLPPQVQVPQTLGSSVPASAPNLAALRAELGLTAGEVRLVLRATAAPGGGESDDPSTDPQTKPGTAGATKPTAPGATTKPAATGTARPSSRVGRALAPPDDLSLETISVLYRYALLARVLKLDVGDLVALVGLSGIDPFTPPSEGPDALEAGDHAGRHTLRFVELVRTFQASGLPVEELDYLLHHRFDPVGPHRGALRPPLELVRTLAAEITRIRSEHAVPADGLTFSDEVLARELALVLEPEVVATFLDLWTGTRRLGGPGGTGEGDSGAAAGREPVPSSFVNDHLARRLVEGVGWVGFLETEGLDLGAFFTPTPSDQEAERSRRQKLAADFLPYLQERLIHRLVVETVASGVASEPELVETLLTDASVLDDPEEPGRSLLDAYVAAGSHGLTITAPPEASPGPNPDTPPDSSKPPDPGTPPTKPGPAPEEPTRPGVPTRPGAPTRPVPGTRPGLDDPVGQHQITGYLEVPATGRYRLSARCSLPGIRVRLLFADRPDPLIRTESTKDDLEPAAVVELRAGLPYSFSLDHNGQDGTDAVRLWLEGTDLPKRQVTDVVTYPRAQVERLHRLHLLVTKTLHLVDALALTEPEVRHLARHPDDFDGLDLGELPVRPDDATGQRAQTLFHQVLRLAGWTQFRKVLGADPEDLVGIVSRARREAPQGQGTAPSRDPLETVQAVLDDLYQHVGMVMRREPEVVREAAELLGMTAEVVAGQIEAPAFANEQGLERLWRVLSLTHRLGIDPQALDRWATPTPNEEVARDVRAAVKARFEPEAWRRVVQPISDELRQRKRDALVAHVLHRGGFDRLEDLFEFFLLDPGTEPVVHTSRLRLAISSVQTFVQRCFLGLEAGEENKGVRPSALNAEQWEWMKRYRVWEANRKIFLWPENWLEPELRVEKSPLFSTMESQLLESDLDEEHAEVALTDYLRGLEEVARLDVRSVYEQGRSGRISAGVPLAPLHVLARTFNEPHKYFYRTRKSGTWSPWLPVEADVTGDQVALAYWRNRVQLLWLTFVERPVARQEGVSSGLEGLRPTHKLVDYQLHWSDYQHGAWSEPTVTAFKDIPLPANTNISTQQMRIHHLPAWEPLLDGGGPAFEDRELGVIRLERSLGTIVVRTRTGHVPIAHFPYLLDRSVPFFSGVGNPSGSDEGALTGQGLTRLPHGVRGSGSLGVEHQVHWTGQFADFWSEGGDPSSQWCRPNQQLLRHGAGAYTLVIAHDESKHGRPFFYGDRDHSFFVEPIWRDFEGPLVGGEVALATAPVNHLLETGGVWDTVQVAAVGEEGTAVLQDTDVVDGNGLLLRPVPDVITKPEVLVSLGDKPITVNGQLSKPPLLQQVQGRPELADQLPPELLAGLVSGKDLR